MIPRSKTDQFGEGQVCAIPYGNSRLCPVNAMRDWYEHFQDQSGYVFCQITKGQQIKTDRIKPNQVNIILKAIAQACQVDNAECYSSHSLRRGFATEASKKGAPFGTIMRQGRWQHKGTVLGYIDEGQRFEQNAVKFMLRKSSE